MTSATDVVSEGLVTFGEKAQDLDLVKGGAMMLRLLRDAYESTVRPDEVCTLAFPSMVIRPDIRTAALVAVFPTRIIAAWEKGVLRKKTVGLVIDRGQITRVDWYVSRKAATQGATLLDIVAGETHTFALPKGDAKLADFVRDAIAP